MLSLMDFIKLFLREETDTHILLDWIWEDGEDDQEYGFDGTPEEFIENYTRSYDILGEYDISNVSELHIERHGCKNEIHIVIQK